MKISLISILFLFNTLCFGQSLIPFIEIDDGRSMRIHDMLVFNDCLYVCGQDNSENAGARSEIVWKYNLEGILLDSVAYGDSDKNRPLFIEQQNDTIYVWGERYYGSDKMLKVTALDTGLNKLWEKTYDVADHLILFNIRIRHKGNHIFLFYNEGISFWIGKFDRNYNMIDFKLIKINTPCTYDPIYDTDTSFVFGTEAAMFTEVDTNLNIINDDYILYFVEGRTDTYRLPNNNYLSCGTGIHDYTPNYIVNDSYEIVQDYENGDDQDDRFTLLRGLCWNNDSTKIYSSGLMDQEFYHEVSFGADYSNEFWVSKFNFEEREWKHSYSDSYYYTTTNMEAAPDGGLFLSAMRYDVANQPDEIDVVVFKVDENGTIPVGLNEINCNLKILVYPNPGQNQIRIKSSVIHGNAEFQMYDINGRQVLQTNCTTNTGIDVSTLQPGIYFYRVFSQTEIVGSGKWVKE